MGLPTRLTGPTIIVVLSRYIASLSVTYYIPPFEFGLVIIFESGTAVILMVSAISVYTGHQGIF